MFIYNYLIFYNNYLNFSYVKVFCCRFLIIYNYILKMIDEFCENLSKGITTNKNIVSQININL